MNVMKQWVLKGMALLMGGMFVISCSESETGGITLDSGSSAVELYAVVNHDGVVKFTADGDWKASCTANWLTFSPKSGQKGSQAITVTTTSTNRTKKLRTAQLLIESGGKEKTVTIRQRDDYAYFDMDELNLGSWPTTVSVTFKTNLGQEDLGIYATQDLTDWFVPQGGGSRTRAEYTGVINRIDVLENTSKEPREGALFLTMNGKDGEILPLDTLFVYQAGADNGYVSIDYSQDGKVEQLNKATEGKGIPIVLMGDGFVDQDIADGNYALTMKQAMDNMFSEEPIKSLKSYFNVYQVTVVSARSRFDGISSTALGTIPDHLTTGVDVNADAVMKYVKKVNNIDSINTLAVVILNTSLNKGITYMMRSSDQEYNYAIALCPVIDNLESETFRQVLTHEAVGHGFAKLADEYVRSTEGSATDDDIKMLKELHERWNWFLNVDAEKDSSKVLWTKFIYDADFANERIGTYEGGYTFYKGIYRPSEESMMRSNNAPFNAPSRQAIYNQVMKLGLGKTPSYEEFKAFDKAHKPTVWSYSRARQRENGQEAARRPAPPRIIWKNW